MLKKLIYGLVAFAVFISISVFLWSRTVPSLSGATEKMIREAIAAKVPELVTGTTGYADSKGVKIWYESKEPVLEQHREKKGVVLLINGMGASALFWPAAVYERLQQQGYQVVLTDNRGLGASDWMNNWTPDNAYTLNDMANDHIAVLDALNIEQVHIIGISMGGMIAQEMSIHYPQRVLSLTSMMSSGYAEDPEIPLSSDFTYSMMKLLIRYGVIKSEENAIKLVLGTYNLLKGEQEIDHHRLINTTLYELRHRRGFNHNVTRQQAAAISLSGSRLKQLSEIKIPSLVIHGESDPLININQAKKYAKQIQNAETYWVKGMGHAGEPAYIDSWMDRVMNFLNGLKSANKVIDAHSG